MVSHWRQLSLFLSDDKINLPVLNHAPYLGSQFFITFDAIPQLNGKAVIFGQIVDRESFEVRE